MTDPYRLERFVEAQRTVYDAVVDELRRGRKATHWMWFVFPQLAGLGRSPTAQLYAISSLAEAKAYLQHPVLGPRLIECARAVADAQGRTAEQILGPTDAMKLRSSMTLFHRAAPEEPVFTQVLERYFDGASDARTEKRL